MNPQEMNGMKIVDVSKEPISETPHRVDARKTSTTPSTRLRWVITLAPGEALKKHITPVDVFFYVLEGTGIVEIGDERAEVEKDHLVDSRQRSRTAGSTRAIKPSGCSW